MHLFTCILTCIIFEKLYSLHCDVITLTMKFQLQYPIGIDSNRFIKALELTEVRKKIKELQEKFSGRKVSD